MQPGRSRRTTGAPGWDHPPSVVLRALAFPTTSHRPLRSVRPIARTPVAWRAMPRCRTDSTVARRSDPSSPVHADPVARALDHWCRSRLRATASWGGSVTSCLAPRFPRPARRSGPTLVTSPPTPVTRHRQQILVDDGSPPPRSDPTPSQLPAPAPTEQRPGLPVRHPCGSMNMSLPRTRCALPTLRPRTRRPDVEVPIRRALLGTSTMMLPVKAQVKRSFRTHRVVHRVFSVVHRFTPSSTDGDPRVHRSTPAVHRVVDTGSTSCTGVVRPDGSAEAP